MMAFSYEITSVSADYGFRLFKYEQCIPRSDAIPNGRSGHRIVSDLTSVYSYGGFNPYISEDDARRHNGDVNDLKMFREIWKFNIAKSEWTKLDYFSSSLPIQTASNALIMKGSLLILHGGTGMPFGLTNTHHTYVADLKRDSSMKLLGVKGSPPSPQYGQAMVLNGHHLYVVGGTSGFDYSSDIHCLDLKTMTWEEVYIARGLSEFEPQGRYRHEIALYNSRIIVFGGGTDTVVFDFESLPAFNLETRQWESLSTKPDRLCRNYYYNSTVFPPARRCHASIQIPETEDEDSKFVICGGYDGIRIFQDVWMLNLRTLQWSRRSDMWMPLYFHSASLSPNGLMFIFGGIHEIQEEDEVFMERSNEIYSCWVKIPKLKEICWEAMIYYNPDMLNSSLTELLNNGIPKEFVERLEF